MKKIFSFLLVICMIIGIGISIANFTAMDLQAYGWMRWYGTHSGDLYDNWNCSGRFSDCSDTIYFP